MYPTLHPIVAFWNFSCNHSQEGEIEELASIIILTFFFITWSEVLIEIKSKPPNSYHFKSIPSIYPIEKWISQVVILTFSRLESSVFYCKSIAWLEFGRKTNFMHYFTRFPNQTFESMIVTYGGIIKFKISSSLTWIKLSDSYQTLALQSTCSMQAWCHPDTKKALILKQKTEY